MVFGDVNERRGFEWKPEEPIKEVRLPRLGSPTPTHVVIADLVHAVNELIRRENERSAQQ